ncbi:MAG: type II/IV secretion system ATPase subunit [archaeon]
MRRKYDQSKQEKRIIDEEIARFTVRDSEKIIVLPETKGTENTDVVYPLIPPFAYARITWNEEEQALIYRVDQPELDEDEKDLLHLISKGLTKTLETNISILRERETLLKYIQQKTKEIIEEYGITLKPGQYTRLMYYIYINFVGLNELEPLMHDNYIEDIGCDGTSVALYVTHKKYGNIKTNISFNTKERLQEFVTKLAERCGKYISYAEPILDGSLPDGSRINSTLASDVTTRGPTFSIRKFRKVPYSVIDLIRLKTATIDEFAYLWYVIEHKVNILICGGTGAGKTSFLNAIVSFIPPEDKIISIEDTQELNLPHENWIPCISRLSFGTTNARGEKYGEVTMFSLLKESFRQNPDYVIVGEVRGTEASVLFQGMASGHPSFGTIHGGSVDDIIKRMQTPPISLSPSLLETLDIVLVISRALQYGKSARRLKSICEIESIDSDSGRARMIKSYQWSPGDDKHEKHKSYVLEKISADYGIPFNQIMEDIEDRRALLEWLYRKKITYFKDVSLYIAKYYKNKKGIMEILKKDIPANDIKEDVQSRSSTLCPLQ